MNIHLHREIENLKKKILAFSTDVEATWGEAVKALKEKDAVLAQRVIDSDTELDRTEVEIEEECLKILALHTPVANDLRFIVAVLKINNDLERIADQAVNIAERAQVLLNWISGNIPRELTIMVNKVQWMLERSLDALINMDSQIAREVIDADDEIDDLNRKLYEIIKRFIRKNTDDLEYLICLLSVSRQLERIADQVTNIAEDVIYIVEGNIVRHKT